jgi:hypoxanthine phosphoribosyltransferase
LEVFNVQIDVLIPESEIRMKVEAMAKRIREDFVGKEASVIGVLKGSFIFVADLVRKIDLPVTCEFLRVSSYKHNQSTGSVKVEFDLSESIEGKHVLLVEDIIDTGRTIRFLIDHLKSKKPASVSICTLLYKDIDPAVKRLIDYIGFEIPNQYVVGYGMDDEGLHRSLPYIGMVRS